MKATVNLTNIKDAIPVITLKQFCPNFFIQTHTCINTVTRDIFFNFVLQLTLDTQTLFIIKTFIKSMILKTTQYFKVRMSYYL